jgi:hypothetical protein
MKNLVALVALAATVILPAAALPATDDIDARAPADDLARRAPAALKCSNEGGVCAPPTVPCCEGLVCTGPFCVKKKGSGRKPGRGGRKGGRKYVSTDED